MINWRDKVSNIIPFPGKGRAKKNFKELLKKKHRDTFDSFFQRSVIKAHENTDITNYVLIGISESTKGSWIDGLLQSPEALKEMFDLMHRFQIRVIDDLLASKTNNIEENKDDSEE